MAAAAHGADGTAGANAAAETSPQFSQKYRERKISDGGDVAVSGRVGFRNKQGPGERPPNVPLGTACPLSGGRTLPSPLIPREKRPEGAGTQLFSPARWTVKVFVGLRRAGARGGGTAGVFRACRLSADAPRQPVPGGTAVRPLLLRHRQKEGDVSRRTARRLRDVPSGCPLGVFPRSVPVGQIVPSLSTDRFAKMRF